MRLTQQLRSRASRLHAYHVLTTLPFGRRGAAWFRGLLREDAELAPVGARPNPWPKGKSDRFRELDADAGDAKYLFLTPNDTYLGWAPEGEEMHNALRVSLDKLFDHGAVGWRPHDLLPAYQGIASQASSDKQRIEWLRIISECATITDPTTIVRVVELQKEFENGGYADKITEEGQRLLEELHRLVPPCRTAGTGIRTYPDHALFYDIREEGPPELLLAGRLPLRCADRIFFSDGHDWVPNPWFEADR